VRTWKRRKPKGKNINTLSVVFIKTRRTNRNPNHPNQHAKLETGYAELKEREKERDLTKKKKEPEKIITRPCPRYT